MCRCSRTQIRNPGSLAVEKHTLHFIVFLLRSPKSLLSYGLQWSPYRDQRPETSGPRFSGPRGARCNDWRDGHGITTTGSRGRGSTKSTSDARNSSKISASPSRPSPSRTCRTFFAAWSSPNAFTRYGTLKKLLICWMRDSGLESFFFYTTNTDGWVLFFWPNQWELIDGSVREVRKWEGKWEFAQDCVFVSFLSFFLFSFLIKKRFIHTWIIKKQSTVI